MSRFRRWLISYVVALVVFTLVDGVWIGLVASGVYRAELGSLLAASFQPVAAIVFYLGYVAGLVHFGVQPLAGDVPLGPTGAGWRAVRPVHLRHLGAHRPDRAERLLGVRRGHRHRLGDGTGRPGHLAVHAAPATLRGAPGRTGLSRTVITGQRAPSGQHEAAPGVPGSGSAGGRASSSAAGRRRSRGSRRCWR